MHSSSISLSNYPKLLFFVFLAISSTLYAAERPKVGLVLSGGGARGVAHIGVLKELERQRIPIDFITGTSMGSIVGGLYASGNSVEEIEEILGSIDWLDIFSDAPPRKDASLRRKFDDDLFQINRVLGFKDGKVKIPSGFIRGQKLQLLLDKLFIHTAYTNSFDQLGIPFRAVATDIASGEAVVLSKGSLATAIRASMSVPGAFTTVKHQGHTLVDGGISNNLPVDVAREMGADLIIAVDIGSPLLEGDALETFLGVTLQMTSLLVRNTTQAQIKTLSQDDVLVLPDLGDFSSSDFEGAWETIEKGEEATKQLTQRLEPLTLSTSEMAALLEKRQNKTTPSALISAVSINNQSSYDDDYLLSRISQSGGAGLNFDRLEKEIGEIYGMGTFESVTYDIVKKEQGSELVINVVEKPWGPRYLQFGLSYESQVTRNNELSGVIGYTLTPANTFNGEWRNILRFGEEPGIVSELHQPLARNSSYFLNTVASYFEQQVNTFEDGLEINQTRSNKLGARLSLGKEFGNSADARIGINRFRVHNRIEFGIPDDFLGRFDGGELFFSARLDTLDSSFFPTEGTRASLVYTNSSDNFGSDFNFEQIEVDLVNATTWGEDEHTVLIGMKYFSTYEGEAPTQSRFRLGGLFNLPGFVTNELSGQHLFLLRGGYQKQLDSILGTEPYLGFTLQHGNVFQDKADIRFSDGVTSVGTWLGWDSLLGPIFLGYGRADTGDSSAYLSIGSLF